ncbi:calcium-binding protein [Hasllibacter sp. MH4015]|uniref:calcium-binding protein n=1 Tax=Hasllibacter sp. MH4015 TaxID=2854029 RepID=UPI001CD5AF3A|nr:calcium-binding protein [Hasllibacter sp. MH4015]
MVALVVQGQVQTGQTALDFGITDLMVIERNGQSVLYASSGQTGGLTAFTLGPSGTANFLDAELYNSAWSDGALRDMALIEVNGAPCLVVAGSGEDQLRLFDVNPDGTIGAAQQLSGMSPALNRLLDVDQAGTGTIYMADTGTGTIRGFELGTGGSMSEALSVTDTAQTYAAEVMAINSVHVGGRDYIISASQTERGVSAYWIDGNTLSNTGNAGVSEGLGIMTPTAMEVVEINGRSFIILASAPNDGQGQSGAITVIEVAVDGSLVDTDHVMDTTTTHFGQVQSLEVIEADGRTYVIAGGGDDGLTLFVLLPHGRLQFLSTIADTPGAGLENVSAMAAHHENGQLHMYVSSEIAGGVTQITADVSGHGMMIQGDHNGGTITGGALDDILIGGAQNDNILGGAGDDLIEDGLGVDTLHGGSGADIFILRSDFTHDVIADFEVGSDRIDLSSWPMLYDLSAIGYTATATGAILDWRGETLEIITENATTLSFSDVLNAILEAPDRVPDFSSFGGNDGDQLIEGTAIDDAVAAGAGADTVLTGAGADFVSGGAGNDLIEGGGQNDTIYGDDGHDIIRGNLGNDLLYGGEGRDTILGDNRNDTIFGENGNDVLRGGNGDDVVDGGAGEDRLFGADNEDTIFGGDGNDLIRAGAQSDVAYGGAGDDFIVGGGGFDTLQGGEGNDTLQGNFNADQFVFEDGHGQDVILDFEALSRPEKLVFENLSTLNSLDDVFNAATQQGADVYIDTGGGNGILLHNVLLSDLDVHDFIF